VVIFVNHSRDDGFSAYGSQVGHITDRPHLDVRGPLEPGLMRPVPVVVDQVLAEHQGQVAFAEDQEPVQELMAEGSDDAFADDGGIKWVIAIDGKVLRGAWTGENDKVTLFSAMLQEEALTIAQVRVPDGTNEITQAEALTGQLGILDGESVLATLDAAHCNRKTAKLIGGKQGWDYLITVKKDKPALYRKAAGKIRPALSREPDDIMTERSRGVIKKWSCWTEIADKVNFPHISQIACACREVFSLTGEKISKDVTIQLTSATQKELSAADINWHTRKHWGIENKEHYIRDTVYAEDGNQSWKGNGPQALASLRNLATGLFRMKKVKSIREATEIVHMDRMMALHYMTTECHSPYTALPANGPVWTLLLL
jgi:predicted transposase YbfD/YdcC